MLSFVFSSRPLVCGWYAAVTDLWICSVWHSPVLSFKQRNNIESVTHSLTYTFLAAFVDTPEAGSQAYFKYYQFWLLSLPHWQTLCPDLKGFWWGSHGGKWSCTETLPPPWQTLFLGEKPQPILNSNQSRLGCTGSPFWSLVGAQLSQCPRAPIHPTPNVGIN